MEADSFEECARRLRDLADELEKAPERWTRGQAAREESGRAAASSSPHACRWCMVGLIQRDRVMRAFFFVKKLCNGSVSDFNDADGRTVEEVIATFRRAAESLPGMERKEESWEEN
jgi:hypothetical protein